MTELPALDGLDDIPWGDLQHAYSPADALPGLIRALADGGAAIGAAIGADCDADEVLEELQGSICHQGSVYPATAAAVPFLARIAASGIRTAQVVYLLGDIAMSSDERGVENPGSARAAVASQADLLVPLLGDPNPDVRAVTAWTLAECREQRLAPALRARFDEESSTVIKAAILNGLPMLGAALAAEVAGGVIAGSRDTDLLAVAAGTAVAAGMPWSGQLEAAATAWAEHGIGLPEEWWPGDPEYDPFAGVLTALAGRGEMDTAAGLAVTAFERAAVPVARKQAVYAVTDLVTHYRVPLQPVIGMLAAMAGDEEAGLPAISLLKRLPDISSVADRLAAVADVRGPSRLADEALACLAGSGDPRAAGLLARDLRDRPSALGAVEQARRARERVLPFDQALLDAARERLRAGDMHGNDLLNLLQVLSAWGLDAAAAVGDLAGLVEKYPLAAGSALAAIGGNIPAAVHALTRAAATGDIWQQLEAAETLHSLTGEDGPLAGAVERGLAGGDRLQRAAEAARAFGTAPSWLVPALGAALARTADGDRAMPAIQARIQVALTLRHWTGDTGTAVAVIAEGLKPRDMASWAWPDFQDAAAAAAELGPGARPLIPALLPLLDQPIYCPGAAQALLRIDPQARGGIPLTDLADRLVAVVADPDVYTPLRAFNVLREIGPAGISPRARQQLRQLAEQPGRVGYQDIIREDEKLRAEIRQLLAEPAGR